MVEALIASQADESSRTRLMEAFTQVVSFFSKFSNIGSSYLSRVSADDKYSPFGRADPQDQVQGQL